MSSILSFPDAMAAIWARSSYDRGFISDPFAGDEAARRGLKRTAMTLERLGHPEQACPMVHVAGSKGKGSTCMVADSILRAAGMRTGRFLSPHLHSCRERFVVDDHMIPEHDFTSLTRDVLRAAEDVERDHPSLGQLTAFELSTVMAFQWFAQSACEVAVIEVGLGGMLDATNVLDPAVSVITTLDYEHTAILGSTMREIARNKAGIIKSHRPVVSAVQPAEGMREIEARAAECDAALSVAGRDWTVTGSEQGWTMHGKWGTIPNLRTGLAGRHQMGNAALAIAALKAAGAEPPFSAIDDDAIRRGVAGAQHPGRFERVDREGEPVVVLDGAHSPAAMVALTETMTDQFPSAVVTVVVGMFADKDPVAVLRPLKDVAAHWIAVAPQNPRALPADDVLVALRDLGRTGSVAPSVAAGMQAASALDCQVVLVTGSLATVSEAREAMGLAGAIDEPV